MARETDLMNIMNRLESLESRIRFQERLENGVGGVVVAIESAEFTGTQSESLADQANTSVDNLSITHTLSNSANKLLLMSTIGVYGSSAQRAQVGFAFADNGTLIGIGAAASNRIRTMTMTGPEGTGSYVILTANPTYVYAPGDTSSHTYTVEMINGGGATHTCYINRTESDSDKTYRPRGSSTFTLVEFSV
jgi:uncharacterized coiled-coil protein SlyX